MLLLLSSLVWLPDSWSEPPPCLCLQGVVPGSHLLPLCLMSPQWTWIKQMFKIISLISNSVFCITVILYIYCPLSAMCFTDREGGKMGDSFMGSDAARLNAPLVAYCNQENSVRDLIAHLLYKTYENRPIKWESRDRCGERGHCLG